MKMTGPLEYLDLQILRLLNVTYGHPVMDQIWLAITHLERQWWFTFVLLPILLGWFIYIYRLRSIHVLFAVALGVAISDALSYRIIKFMVNRPRPFENPEIASWLRHVGDAHGPSFPSNHAANCFAGAVILAWYFRSRAYLFYIFATLVGLSRIALGVHYPSDVIAGAMLGILVGILVRSLLLNRVSWFRLEIPVSSSDADSAHWRRRIRRPTED